MGNLLGSPVTEKETHVGITLDSHTADRDGSRAVASLSPDGGGMEYGVSSMQGWRVHMEDAHIAQPFLYAEKCSVYGAASGTVGDGADVTPCKKTAIEATLSGKDDANVSVTEKTPVGTAAATCTNSSNTGDNYVRIPLPNHSLFAVFDGHGGSFAAEYAALNLLRVLTRDATFCEYAEKWRGREAYKDEWQERNAAALSGTKMTAEASSGETQKGGGPERADDDQRRLQQLHKRGRDSDEKAKDTNIDISTSSETAAAAPSSGSNDTLEFALATYDQELMTLLEHSLRDAFMDLDAEIVREVRGEKVRDANLPYGVGYDLSQHSLQGSTSSHSPNAKTGTTTDSSNAHHLAPPPTPNDDEDSGTTAVVVLTTPRWLVCANAGDSRAVYSRSSRHAVPLSYDHKPEDEDEERRIREAGGYVSGGRVEGDLAVSRGLGDFRFKDVDTVLSGARGERAHQRNNRGGTSATAVLLQRDNINQATAETRGEEKEDVPMMRPSKQKVSPEPDIIVQNRNPAEDEFILICCDGIWDVQTNQESVKMVADIFEEGERDLGLVCEEILDLCLIKGSKDNMTAAVVKLPKQVIGKGGGVIARRECREASSSTASNADIHGGEPGRVYNPYLPPHNENKERDGDDDK